MSSYIHQFRAYLRNHETARGLFLVGVIILGAITVWGGIRLALNTEYPILVVSSYSMCQRVFDPNTNLCTLDKGDLIVVRGVSDPTTLQVPSQAYQTANCCGASLNPQGSIIVFYPHTYDPGFLVVHRVYSVVTNTSTGAIQGFDTKGDGNPRPDGWTIPPSQIIGEFQFTIPIPYLGTAILDIRDFMYNSAGQVNPQGILVIVALIVALFAFEVMEPGKKSSSSKSKTKSEETSGNQSGPDAASSYETPK